VPVALLDEEPQVAALVVQVASLERPWHEEDAAAAAETGKKKRKGRTTERAETRTERTTAATVADAAQPAPDAVATNDNAAVCALVTDADVAGKGQRDLMKMCDARGLAQYGSKEVLIKRLKEWVPGVRKSNRGAKRAAAPKAQPIALVPLSDPTAEEEDEIEDAAVDDGACADYYVTDEFALQAGLNAAAFMNELHAGDFM